MRGVALDEDEATGVALEASLGKAQFSFKVYAFEAAGGTPIASGSVVATANLEYADVNRGRLHFSLEAEDSLGADFIEKFGVHATGAVASHVGNSIGPAGMNQIIKDIVNGGGCRHYRPDCRSRSHHRWYRLGS